MSNSIETEFEKLKFKHREGRKKLAEIIGMTINDQDRFETTIAQGIRIGTIRYVHGSGESEVLGELHVALEKGNKKTDKIFEITDEGQDAYFLGFQDGINQIRKRP